MIYCSYIFTILPLRFNYAQTKTDCGVFVRYDKQIKSGKGSTWTVYWLIIQSQTAKEYKFLYHSKYHKSFSFIKTDLQQGQKLCFEYFNPWVEHQFGKTFLKSIKLTQDK